MRFEAMHAMMFFLPDTHREVLRLLLAWLQRISDDAHRHHVLASVLYCLLVSTTAISSSRQNRTEQSTSFVCSPGAAHARVQTELSTLHYTRSHVRNAACR